MQLPNLLPDSELLAKVEGVETGLLRQNRLRRIGYWGVAVSTLELLILGINSEWVQNLLTFNWQALRDNWFVLLSLLIFAFFLMLVVWSQFWLKESKKPFRYTLSIANFEPIEPSPGNSSRIDWLRHDLLRLFSIRVRRFSLLEENAVTPPDAANEYVNNSHIHISGHYLIRSFDGERCAIEVMPRIRIGGTSQPESLARVPPFYLDIEDAEPSPPDSAGGEAATPPESAPPSKGCGDQLELTDQQYASLLERVYSSVVTEIYRQIRSDVQRKIDLLPADRFRFAAYFHEAEDYANSNTIDAYDEASKLYEKAIELFDIAEKTAPAPVPSRWRIARWRQQIAAFFRTRWQKLRTSIRLWLRRRIPSLAKREVSLANAEIGYARMLVYRRALAYLSGRLVNPVFEARRRIDGALERLDRLPSTPDRDLSLFHGCVTAALAYNELGATNRAIPLLMRAKQLNPLLAETNPTFIYASGMLESRLGGKVPLLRRAVELDAQFEIAQFQLAGVTELIWRNEQSLERQLGRLVIEEYERVLRINPGNISAWANIGYMRWLIDDGKPASRMKIESALETGRNYKDITPETMVAELDYGLARLAAERNQTERAYEYYTRALSAQFMRGIWGQDANFIEDYYFSYINECILERFQRYRDNYAGATDMISRSVYAFVLNDYGSACLSYYVRTHDEKTRDMARAAFEQALEQETGFALAYYNLARLASADANYTEAEHYLAQVLQLQPLWTQAIQMQASIKFTLLRNLPQDIQMNAEDIQSKRDELDDYRRDSLPAFAEKSGSFSTELGEPAAQTLAPAVSDTPENREEKLAALQNELDNLLVRQARLERRLHEERDELVAPIQKLLPHTFFQRDGAPLIDAAGTHVDHLVNDTTIRWERDLNELHVRALAEWANALTEATDNPAILKAALLLHRHILRHFYPEDWSSLDRSIGTRQWLLLQSDEELAAIGLDRETLTEESEQDRRLLQAMIIDILPADPIHYGLLSWLDFAFDLSADPFVMSQWETILQIHFTALETSNLSYAAAFIIVDRLIGLNNQLEDKIASLPDDAEDFEGDMRGLIESIAGHVLQKCHNVADSLTTPELIEGFVTGLPAQDFYSRIERLIQFLWKRSEYDLVRSLLETISGRLDASDSTWREGLIGALLPYMTTSAGINFWKTWLAEACRVASQKGDTPPARDAVAAQMRLVHSTRLATFDPSGQMRDQYPVVTPIAVEAHEALFPTTQGWWQGHDLFMRFIPDMRERVKLKTGIDIPGVRVRTPKQRKLPTGGYEVIIDEIPMASGTVYGDRRFYPDPSGAMSALAPGAAPSHTAPDPGTGRSGVWLRPEDVQDAGQESWHPYDYFIRHLEAVVERQIERFLPWQQYETMLTAWGSINPENQTRLNTVMPSRAERLRLYRVWRQLLRDGVYLPVGDVVTHFEALTAQAAEPADLAEAMRLRVRDRLPGNDSERVILLLPEPVESAFASAVRPEGLLMVSADQTTRLKGLFAGWLSRPDDKPLAIVVRNPVIRRHVRRFIEQDYPAVPVLATREVMGNFATYDVLVDSAPAPVNGKDS